MVEGKTSVNEAVFQFIVKEVLRNIDDIVEKDRKGALADFPKVLLEKFSLQVTVDKNEQPEVDFGEVNFTLKLAIVYGTIIPEAAARVRTELAKDVEKLTGYKVTKVDIVFDRVVEMKELEAGTQEEK